MKANIQWSYFLINFLKQQYTIILCKSQVRIPKHQYICNTRISPPPKAIFSVEHESHRFLNIDKKYLRIDFWNEKDYVTDLKILSFSSPGFMENL